MHNKKVLIAFCVAVTALLPLAAKVVSPASFAPFAGHFYTSLAYAYFIALVAMLAIARQFRAYEQLAVVVIATSVVLFLSELLSVGLPQVMSSFGVVASLQGVLAGCALSYGFMQFLFGPAANLEPAPAEEDSSANISELSEQELDDLSL